MPFSSMSTTGVPKSKGIPKNEVEAGRPFFLNRQLYSLWVSDEGGINQKRSDFSRRFKFSVPWQLYRNAALEFSNFSFSYSHESIGWKFGICKIVRPSESVFSLNHSPFRTSSL